MKVILKRSIENLGEPGEVVSVKAGYARNYLLPQNLAYAASAANMQRIEEEQKKEEERVRRDYLEGKRRAAQLEGNSLIFRARASEEGRLYGSVAAGDIADQLNEGTLDFEVERRHVLLDDPIKQLGVHYVLVRMLTGVEVEVEIHVEPEDD